MKYLVDIEFKIRVEDIEIETDAFSRDFMLEDAINAWFDSWTSKTGFNAKNVGITQLAGDVDDELTNWNLID